MECFVARLGWRERWARESRRDGGGAGLLVDDGRGRGCGQLFQFHSAFVNFS